MKKINAKFKCLTCGCEYEDSPGPTICPMCKHQRIKWLNYEYFEKRTNAQLNEIQRKRKENEKNKG